MPKVPVYDQQVKPREVQVPQSTRPAPVQDAFGTQVQDAHRRLGEQISKTATVIQNRLVEIQRRDDDQEVLERGTTFGTELQNMLHNSDPDDAGVPFGMLDRQLEQTRGATVEYDNKVNAMQKKYLDSVKGVDQKAKLYGVVSGQALSGRDQVIRHESSQRSQAFDKTVEASNKMAVNMAAGTPDPVALGILMQTSGQSYGRILNQGKVPGADGLVQALHGDMVEASFNSQLEDNPAQAKKILDMHAGVIGQGRATKLMKALEGKMLYEQQAGIYQDLSKYRMADGFPDLRRMQQEVMRMPNATMEKKNRIWNYVEGRAGEERQQMNQQRDASDRTFTNQIADLKKNGGSMDQALKLVPNMAYDPTDRLAKEEYVRKLYMGPQITDPIRYIELWEGIQNSTKELRDIDLGIKEGWLKGSDWSELRKEYYRSQTGGDTPGEKEVRQRVKIVAEDSIHDKKDSDEFLYVWHTNTRGMAPEEKFQYAQDLLKKRDSGKWYKPNQKAYKVELQGLDSEAKEKSALYGVMGRTEANAIAKGIMGRTGKQTWSVSDFNAFAKEFGGPEKIQPGTPVYNAIQSLMRYRKAITPASIRTALENYPEGKF